MVQFCLEPSRKQCIGISLVSDVNTGPERVKVQSKKGNISKSQREWTFENGILKPFLFNNTYVAIDVDKYLVVVKNGLMPVLFTNAPRFRSLNGLCVVPMKCNRNELGFCSKTSDERAIHLANGAMLKLLPCLPSTPDWTIITTFSPTFIEYEHPIETVVPTVGFSPSTMPSFSASSMPSSYPSMSPSFSPSEMVTNISTSSTSLPTTSPSFENETISVIIPNVVSVSYVGVSALVIIVAMIIVVFLNCRKRFFVK